MGYVSKTCSARLPLFEKFNPLSGIATKLSNKLKQFVGNSRQFAWVALIILWVSIWRVHESLHPRLVITQHLNLKRKQKHQENVTRNVNILSFFWEVGKLLIWQLELRTSSERVLFFNFVWFEKFGCQN